MNGFGGLLDRFGTYINFGNDGGLNNGYGILVYRADQTYNDSTVYLVQNGIAIAAAPSTFQFDASVVPTVTYSPNGSISGSIAGSGQTFDFNFGPRSVSMSGNNLEIAQALPDSRASTYTFPTIDNLSVTYGLSPLTLAELSADAYHSQPVGADGFSPIDSTNLGNGFGAVAYQDGNQIVVAFRGTDPNSITVAKDLFADQSFATGIPTSSLELYVKQASDFLATISGENLGNIILTGHSLGGAIAELVGHASGYAVDAFDAPGPAALETLLTVDLSTAEGLNSMSPGDIVNYRYWGDQISTHGTQIGSVITIGPVSGQSPNGVSWSEALGVGGAHDINNLIEALQSGAAQSTGVQGPVLNVQNFIVDISVVGLDTYFIASVEPLVDYAFDPAQASQYTFMESLESPFLASLTLPQIDGITSYELSVFSDGTWSSDFSIFPNMVFDFGPDVMGFTFWGSDRGNLVPLDSPFLFDLTFASAGTVDASLHAAPTVPEPSPLMVSVLPLALLAFLQRKNLRLTSENKKSAVSRTASRKLSG